MVDPSKRLTKEDMVTAEREIGENIPEEMVGLDSGDVRHVERHKHPRRESKT